MPKRIAITGVGVIAPEPDANEITAFEPQAGEPTWGFECVDFESSVKGYADRTSQMLLSSAELALKNAQLLDADNKCTKTVGISYGSEWGCLDSMELFYAKLKEKDARFAPPLPFSHSYVNSSASHLAIHLGLSGYHAVYTGGPTSGGAALTGAFDAITLGRANCILACAADSFSRAAFRHYHANGQLAASKDDTADGKHLMSEGASGVVLTDDEAAENILGYIISVSDTIEDALKRADTKREDIDNVIESGNHPTSFGILQGVALALQKSGLTLVTSIDAAAVISVT